MQAGELPFGAGFSGGAASGDEHGSGIADDLTSPNAVCADDAPTRLAGSMLAADAAGTNHPGASAVPSSDSTTPVQSRRRSSWPCAVSPIGPPRPGQPVAASPSAIPSCPSNSHLADRATLDPDPPRIREAGTAPEGAPAWALATPHSDADGSDPVVAAPARGVAIAALPATGVGLTSAGSHHAVALAALERPNLRRLELTEQPDGSLSLSVAFTEPT